jgi:myo-inositol-1(or 4)-monophosphatase
MMPFRSDPHRAQLREVLEVAGRLALNHFGNARAVAKPDGSQVTAADREVEDFLVDALRQVYPEDSVISEEGTRIDDGRCIWHVDPIDGTSAFIEGLAHWGPAICRVDEQGLQLGAFYVPRLNEFWYARRGFGAFRNDVRLGAGDPGLPGRHHSLFVPSRFHRAAPLPWPGKVRALGSSAAHLALVASGAGLLALIPQWKLWDIGAGVLLIEESGRLVRDIRGNRIDVTTCQPGLPIVAGASSALDQVLASGWLERALK